MTANKKQKNSNEPAIIKNSKVSQLTKLLDIVFVPFSTKRYFLRPENYGKNAGNNIRTMRPIIYFAETGKIGAYALLLNEIANKI